jgi:hypothetical protein
MALVNKNLITQGLSGSLGRTLVFRRVNGKTIVATTPTPSKNVSSAQLNQREKFQQAVLYAKSQLANPANKAEYESSAKPNKSISAYNIAVADFFNAPNISEVDLTGYSGSVNDTIRVKVTDDFKVTAVKVDIHDAGGNLVESGNAVMQPNKQEWIFKATVSNPSIDGDRITIKATDQPGNETVDTHTL